MMGKTMISDHGILCYARVLAGFLFIVLLGLLLVPIVSDAQQPTAMISSFRGGVFVVVQGNAPAPATVGMVLQAGDSLETQAGSQVMLTLSEGSELQLGQNTKIDIAVLARRPRTNARESKVKLLWGRVRAFLSPGHQERGSSFEVETPNTLAGVKFSRPEIQVQYDPVTETTIVDAYTVEMIVRNLITQEVQPIFRGQRGVIRNEGMSFSPIPAYKEDTSEISEEEVEEEVEEEIEEEVEEEVVSEPTESDVEEEAIQEISEPEPEEESLETPPEVGQEEPAPDQKTETDSPEPSITGPKTSAIPTEAKIPERPKLRNTSTILLQTRNSVKRSTSTSAPSSVGTVGTRETDGSGTTEGEAEGATETATTDSTTDSSTTVESSTGSEGSGGVASSAETSSNPSPGVRPTRAERQPRVVIIRIGE